MPLRFLESTPCNFIVGSLGRFACRSANRSRWSSHKNLLLVQGNSSKNCRYRRTLSEGVTGLISHLKKDDCIQRNNEAGLVSNRWSWVAVLLLTMSCSFCEYWSYKCGGRKEDLKIRNSSLPFHKRRITSLENLSSFPLFPSLVLESFAILLTFPAKNFFPSTRKNDIVKFPKMKFQLFFSQEINLDGF